MKVGAKIKGRAALALALALLPAAAVRAQGGEGIEARLDGYARAAVERFRFSGVVLVARGDRVLFGKGYGMADYELGVPNTTRTRFRVGSLTKQFTAAAILLLQERGALSVRDPVCRYLPRCPGGWEAVTLHHLLSHTSGLPDVSHLEKMELPLNAERAVAYLSGRPLRFAPGARFSYGGSNYVLLGYVVEKASGRPYEAFLREHLLGPAGMHDTGYDDGRPAAGQRAAGYSARGETLVSAAHVEMSVPFAAGGLYSTAEDLHRWARALGARRVLGERSLAAMFTPGAGGYGYGWYVNTHLGRRFVSHGGWINGFAAAIARLPDEGVTAVVLSNNDGVPVNAMARDLSALALGARAGGVPAHRAVKVEPAAYDAYVGRYLLSSGLAIEVVREGDKLFGRAEGYPPVEMRPESGRVFFVRELGARLTFVEEGGAVTHLLIDWDGRELHAVRVEAERPRAPAATRLNPAPDSRRR